MRTALICGKWNLPVLPGKTEITVGHARSYYTFVNGRTNEVGRNVQCVEHLISLLPPNIETVVEVFGGVGIWATLIRNTIKPKRHIAFELNTDCFAQLQNAFEGQIELRNEDCRGVFGRIPADLFVLDFPSPSTIKSHALWEDDWRQMTSQEPKAIIWHDSASRYLHFHGATYSKIAGFPVTDHASYSEAMSNFMFGAYGYHILANAYSQSGHFFLAVPGIPEPIRYYHVLNGMAGFEWKAQDAIQPA